MSEHAGNTPAECPACRPSFEQAQRLQAAKPHKMYGRITANGRKQAAASHRDARAIFDRLFKEHHAAVTR